MDVSDPLHPYGVGSSSQPKSALGVTAIWQPPSPEGKGSGNYRAYVADGPHGLKLFDAIKYAVITISGTALRSNPWWMYGQVFFDVFIIGFLGLLFFFWVGLNADLHGLFREPALAIFLYLAGTMGKLVGVFLMVPMKKITVREAWIIGIGLDARLTTEIIVAQLLFDAKLIDGHLFTALVSAASFTAVTVPLLFALLARHWAIR